MIECSQKVRSVCPYRKTCGGGVYKEGSACDKFAESLQNKKAHKPGGVSITRDQVEKMRGMWIGNDGTEVDMVNEYTQRSATCSECKSYLVGSREYYCKGNFCPACGAPMTDKAVDILWERLEAMQNAAD